MLRLNVSSESYEIPKGLQKWIKQYNNDSENIFEIDVESIDINHCSVNDISFLMKISQKIRNELDSTYVEFSKSYNKTYVYTPTPQETMLENNYDDVNIENTWHGIPDFKESYVISTLKKISECKNGWYKEPKNAYHQLSTGIIREKYKIKPNTNNIIANPIISKESRKHYDCFNCGCHNTTFFVKSTCCDIYSCIQCYMSECTTCKFCESPSSPQRDIVIVNDGKLQLPFSIYTGKFKSLMSNDIKISVESDNKKINEYISNYLPILVPSPNKEKISFESDLCRVAGTATRATPWTLL
jgi:hypothetical protein